MKALPSLRHRPLFRALLVCVLLAPLGAGIAPARAQQGAEPLPGDTMTAPPVIDPKGVETQPLTVDPAAPADQAQTSPDGKPDGFGETVELKPSAILQKAGESNWDDGYNSIVAALKDVDAELARLNLKASGPPTVIYTATDDTGFDFEVAVPFTGVTTEKPKEGFQFSASVAGKALRFTHRGPYDAMDPTYEQIANLLDAKDLEAQDLYIEEYRTDPRTTSQDDLVIDIYVPLK
ncbi:GyrI-like domain-containing protein [Ancylobacter terrae]|uniref:GyrI-like domain-containing protein n=1 Tax=Ancylobacter sp. sgz301288 TaxID=3342077 RepID=UPI00385AC1DD